MTKYLLLILFVNYNLVAMEKFGSTLNKFFDKLPRRDIHAENVEKAFKACEKGDLDAMKNIIGDKDVNSFTKTNGGNYKYGKNTLLHVACIYCHIDIVKYLIEQGADINALSDCHYTPLHRAHRSPEIIKLLIDNGADVNIKDRDGNTFLHTICETLGLGNEILPVIRKLLDAGADINVKDRLGMCCPIHKFLSHEWPVDIAIQVVKLFLDHGLDIDQKDSSGLIPLYYAYDARNSQLANFLISNGADINRDFTMPLSRACKSFIGMKRLVENNSYNLDYINEIDRFGMTPLHYACKIRDMNEKDMSSFIDSGEYFDIVNFLIKNGADINKKDNLGNTPLYYACELNKSYTNVIELLITNGAGITSINTAGESVLYAACKNLESYVQRCGLTILNSKNRRAVDIIKYLIAKCPLLCYYKNNSDKYALDWLSCDNFIRVMTSVSIEENCYSENTLSQAIDFFNRKFYELIDNSKSLIDNFNHVKNFYTNIINSQDLLQVGKLLNLNIIFTPTEIATLINQQILSDNFHEEFVMALIRKVSTEFNVSKLLDGAGNNILSSSLSLGIKTRKISILLMTIFGLGNVNITSGPEVTEFLEISERFLHCLPLFEACKRSELDQIKSFISKFGINAILSDGNNLLHYACMNNNINAVKYLLDQGINVNAINSHGQLPLQWACNHDNGDIIDLLISNGARTDVLETIVLAGMRANFSLLHD